MSDLTHVVRSVHLVPDEKRQERVVVTHMVCGLEVREDAPEKPGQVFRGADIPTCPACAVAVDQELLTQDSDLTHIVVDVSPGTRGRDRIGRTACGRTTERLAKRGELPTCPDCAVTYFLAKSLFAAK